MENTTVEVPAKFKDIVAGVEKLTLIELHELVKMLEAKWGVSAAAAVAAAGESGHWPGVSPLTVGRAISRLMGNCGLPYEEAVKMLTKGLNEV